VLALAGYGYLGLEAPRQAAQLPLLDPEAADITEDIP
jgi:hypothetical protein